MDLISNYWWALLLIAFLIILTYWIVFKRKVMSDYPTGIPLLLDQGWQFFPNPTTASQPGTIFRIAPGKKKFHVGKLPIKYHEADEAIGTTLTLTTTATNIGGYLTGGKSLDLEVKGDGERSSNFQFSITSPVREYVGDVEIDAQLATFYDEKFKKGYRANNKYFIIRETIKGNGMQYQLSHNQVMKLGGEAKLKEALALKSIPFKIEKKNNYELTETFNAPMRILLLVDAIEPSRYGLSDEEVEFERVPVKTIIEWIE